MAKRTPEIQIEGSNIWIPHETARTLARFRACFPDAIFNKALKSWRIMAMATNVERVTQHFGRFDVPNIPKPKFDHLFKTKPYPHQFRALELCEQRSAFGYFMEPGLGKTKTLIDDVNILKSNNEVDTVLVVTPKSVINTWHREIAAHSYDPTINWMIVNPDSLTGKSGKGFKKAYGFLTSSAHNLMCIDESTMIVNPDSLRSKTCLQLGQLARYRRVMTGDPIADKPTDIYNQLYWLDPQYVRGRNFYAFRNHYCIMGGYKKKQIIGYRNLDGLSELIATSGYRVKTTDVIDMPPQNWQVRDIELSKKSLALYNKVVQDEIVPLFEHNDTITARIILSKMVKLIQICGGVVRTDQGVVQTGTEKLNEVELLLNEIRQPVLVWCHFTAEIELLLNHFQSKIKVEKYDGGVTEKNRGDIERRFENGEIDMLILQDDTGHLGLTLNRAPYSIFYSNHLRSLVRNQAERRNWRIGQDKPVFYYDLLTENLMDRYVYSLVRNKRRINDEVYNGIGKQQVMEIIYGHN